MGAGTPLGGTAVCNPPETFRPGPTGRGRGGVTPPRVLGIWGLENTIGIYTPRGQEASGDSTLPSGKSLITQIVIFLFTQDLYQIMSRY